MRTLFGMTLVLALTAPAFGEGPFTMLAPTDVAFAELPAGTVEDLLKPEDKAKLTAFLMYHVLPSKAMAADLVRLDGKSVKTVQRSPVQLTVDGGAARINDAKVTETDISCTSGIIHVIDIVLMPPPTP